jgi:hypothetical protein
MRAKKKILTEEIVQEIVRRIVRRFNRKRLFFSAPRRGKRWDRIATWICWS